MDIGTAKPTLAERDAVPHHLIDVADPSRGVVGRADAGARAARRSPTSKRAGERALLVGGTGLYVRAVVDDARDPRAGPRRYGPQLDARPPTTRGVAARVRASCDALDPGRRGAHRTGQPPAHRARARGDRRDRPSVLVVRSRLRRRTAARARRHAGRLWLPRDDARRADRGSGSRRMRAAGPGRRGRARSPAPPGGLSRTARAGDRLRGDARATCDGDAPVARRRASTSAVRRTRQFARRQRVWFRRDPRIRWIAATEEIRSDLAAGDPGNLAGSGSRLDRPMTTDAPRQAPRHRQRLPRPRSRSTTPTAELDARTVAALCDRHRGIGADGLITRGARARRRRLRDDAA